VAAAIRSGGAAGYSGDYVSLGAIPLIQCSIVKCGRWVGVDSVTCVRDGAQRRRMQRLISTSDSVQQVTVSIRCTTEHKSKLSQTCTFPLSCQLTNANLKAMHTARQCQSHYSNTYTLLACTSDTCLYKE